MPVPSSTVKAGEEKVTSELGFSQYSLHESLVSSLTALNLTTPTPIQSQVLSATLSPENDGGETTTPSSDIIALAQTGSGKTLAFALPILQSLVTSDNPKPFWAFIIAPTRELAFQTSQVFSSLGESMGVRTATIVGGMDVVEQQISLGKRPHIVVATPGRLVDHLEHTKGFTVSGTRYLILDEADRLLDLDFGPALDRIVKHMPQERNTYLFSATMTTKVAKLQRACLRDPIRLEVSTKYETVSTLLQYYILLPPKHKDLCLVYLVHNLSSSTSSTGSSSNRSSMIIFTRTVSEAHRLSALLRILNFATIPLHGQLSQSARLSALSKFKSGEKSILVATDVAARGLDIPHVDYVINYHLPLDSKSYIHRVGRTARAGRAGKSISMVTQYDVEIFQRLEGAIGKKMEEWQGMEKGGQGRLEMMMLGQRVGEAQREAAQELRELGTGGKGGKRGRTGGKRAFGEGGGGEEHNDNEWDKRDQDEDVQDGPARKKQRKGNNMSHKGKKYKPR